MNASAASELARTVFAMPRHDLIHAGAVQIGPTGRLGAAQVRRR